MRRRPMRTLDDLVGRIVILAVLGLLLPGLAAGQGPNTGAISGVVRDTTGAVLPGSTVEAASPALIERVRLGVSNAEGQYQIQNLRPGTYTVTFTLPGFSTLVREGVVLTTGFTATVNAELQIGGVEETITVTGASPVVDIRTTATRQAFPHDIINELPTAKEFSNLAVLIPGMTQKIAGSRNTQDVGGQTIFRNPTLSIHGSATTDMPQSIDGLRIETGDGPGAGRGGWIVNSGIVEEVLVETSGMGAESETSGVQINLIPKQGGNAFSGSVYSAYTNDSLQGNNLDSDLIARGVTSRAVTRRIWDFNPSFGGPLKRDKVWFYYSFRNSGAIDRPPGAFFDTNVTDFVYTPDLSRPADSTLWRTANDLRVTWQVSPNHKLLLYGADLTPSCVCHQTLTALNAPEVTPDRISHGNHRFTARWNWLASNSLLFEVASLFGRETYEYTHPDAAPDGISAVDVGTGVLFRAPRPALISLGGSINMIIRSPYIVRGKGSVSYVTGAHNLKVGTQWLHAGYSREFKGDTQYVFRNGEPISLNMTGNGKGTQNVKLGLGIYAQDSWTLNRLTLNLGGRFDYVNAYIPAQQFAASKWMGPRSFPAVPDNPNWKDVSPRVGVSYDVFGTGRTAIKFNWGRFVEAMATQFGLDINPALTGANGATSRSWNDLNGDIFPQEAELGPSTNLNFGTSFVTLRYADAVTKGWGKRAVNYATSISFQHELLEGVGVNGGYYHRNRGHFRVRDNVLVTGADYDPFCVTAPVDSRLPGGGGNQLCGLADINPAKLGVSDTVVSFASDFGEQSEIFDGVDVNVTVRLPGGRATFFGGTSTGRIKTNRCFVVDSPQELLHCDVNRPFQTQIKLSGVYPLPWWGLRTSATYQNIAPPEILARWAAPASAVTGLGRPLAGGARTVRGVPLVAPGTMYGERLNQLDLRVAKGFDVGQVNIEGQFDLYNVLNGNAVMSMSNTFGSAWQRPTAFLLPRLAKFGVRVEF